MFVAVLTERPGGQVRLTVSGELDLAAVPGFRRELRAATSRLAGTSGEALVVDLAGTTWVDSVGIGLLLGAARRAAEIGARYAVEGATVDVADLLRRTGVDRALGLQE